jgi:hypothetical protein
VNDEMGRVYAEESRLLPYEILSKIFLERVRETAKIFVWTGSI